MKILLTLLVLLAPPAQAHDMELVPREGYVMGAGAWTCARALEVALGDDQLQKTALIGWLMGAWSMSTFFREPGYSDVIEEVGGEQLYRLTMQRCDSGPGEVLVHTVLRSMIDNTAGN